MTSSILHVGPDPTALVDRAILDDAVDRVVVEFGALLSLHDSVETGLAMMYRMGRMFRPTARGLTVRLPDLADVHLPPSALAAALDDVGAAAGRLRGSIDTVLMAGASRDFLGRGGSFRAIKAFGDVRYTDDPPRTPAQVASGMWDSARDARSVIDLVVDAPPDCGKSDLLNALVTGRPLGPSAHLAVICALADTYHSHSALGGDLSSGDGDDGDRFRMASPSFSFILGSCRVLIAGRGHDRGDGRPPMLSRYDKASYVARRRLASATEALPSRPCCVAALLGDSR